MTHPAMVVSMWTALVTGALANPDPAPPPHQAPLLMTRAYRASGLEGIPVGKYAAVVEHVAGGPGAGSIEGPWTEEELDVLWSAWKTLLHEEQPSPCGHLPSISTEARLESAMPNELPDLLRDYVERNVPNPPSEPTGTLLHQTGHIRLSPDGAWLPFTAEQTIRAATTGFVWHARCKMAPLVTAVVEDAFEDGHGRLDAKLWGAIPVAHGRGPDFDRGEAERYLAELAWCPTAFVHNPDLHFETLDAAHIRVWAFDEKTYVDLLFDADGDIRGARTTTRKRDGHVQPWAGRFSEYRMFECGIRAPSQGEVWWEDEEGDFLYWRGEITDLTWKPS